MKRYSFFSIISILVIICLISCSLSGSSNNKKGVKVGISAGMNKEKESYPVDVKSIDEIIDEGDFDDATKFDGDIALISLIMADNASTEKKIKDLFSLLELDNIVCMGENKDLSRLVALHMTDAAWIMLLDYVD